MTSKARRNSFISSTSFDTRSNYSQSTGDEQDDYDDPTAEDTRDSHVTTPNKHPEALEIYSEKAQSLVSSDTYAKDSLPVMLTNMKTTVTDLIDKALSKASLSGGELHNRLRSAEEERDHYRERKEDYKEYKAVLEEKVENLTIELAASQAEVVKSQKARNEMIEMGKKIFAA